MFKRAAKTTLPVCRRELELGPELRAQLAERIRPMLDYFAVEIAELAVRRFAEPGDHLEVAFCAFITAHELPQPRSSFLVTPRPGCDLGKVEELPVR